MLITYHCFCRRCVCMCLWIHMCVRRVMPAQPPLVLLLLLATVFPLLRPAQEARDLFRYGWGLALQMAAPADTVGEVPRSPPRGSHPHYELVSRKLLRRCCFGPNIYIYIYIYIYLSIYIYIDVLYYWGVQNPFKSLFPGPGIDPCGPETRSPIHPERFPGRRPLEIVPPVST
jgi:hypothetical protein